VAVLAFSGLLNEVRSNNINIINYLNCVFSLLSSHQYTLLSIGVATAVCLIAPHFRP
jgi:hypothetical protein